MYKLCGVDPFCLTKLNCTELFVVIFVVLALHALKRTTVKLRPELAEDVQHDD